MPQTSQKLRFYMVFIHLEGHIIIVYDISDLVCCVAHDIT